MYKSVSVRVVHDLELLRHVLRFVRSNDRLNFPLGLIKYISHEINKVYCYCYCYYHRWVKLARIQAGVGCGVGSRCRPV